jgi:hypothetical protein
MTTDGTKLITFRAPHSILTNFDQIIKFKRGSRTSYLVSYMDHFVRTEFTRLKETNQIHELITQLSEQTSPLYDPPRIPDLDQNSWREVL